MACNECKTMSKGASQHDEHAEEDNVPTNFDSSGFNIVTCGCSLTILRRLVHGVGKPNDSVSENDPKFSALRWTCETSHVIGLTQCETVNAT